MKINTIQNSLQNIFIYNQNIYNTNDNDINKCFNSEAELEEILLFF